MSLHPEKFEYSEKIQGKMDAVALRRKIGCVIQQVGLFPHDRRKNIAVVPEILWLGFCTDT